MRAFLSLVGDFAGANHMSAPLGAHAPQLLTVILRVLSNDVRNHPATRSARDIDDEPNYDNEDTGSERWRTRLRYWPGVQPVARRNDRTKFDSEENLQTWATSAIDFPATRSDFARCNRCCPTKRLGDWPVDALNMREK